MRNGLHKVVALAAVLSGFGGGALAQVGGSALTAVPMPTSGTSDELLKYVVWAVVASMLGLGGGALLLINKLVDALLKRNADLVPVLEAIRTDMTRRDQDTLQRERDMTDALKACAAGNHELAEAVRGLELEHVRASS